MEPKPKPSSAVDRSSSPANLQRARRGRKRRSFRSVLRCVIAVALVIGVTASGTAAYYGSSRLARITSAGDQNLKAVDRQMTPLLSPATEPAVALVLGYDERFGSGATRGRAESLMLIRVAPRAEFLSVLSLPRDLYANVPGLRMRTLSDVYTSAVIRWRSRR